MVLGRRPNHLLHFLIVSGLISAAVVLTIFGAVVGAPFAWTWLLPVGWGVIWIALSMRGEQREIISVDEYGNVQWTRL